MTWKKVINSDAGTADKFGGNDLDKVSDAFNGVDVSDPIKYNTDINTLYANTNAAGDLLKGNGTKYVRLPRGTANQVLAVNSGATDVAWATLAAGSGDITAGANVGTGAGLVFKDKTGSTLNFKRLTAGTNVTITNGTSDITIDSTGGGGGTSIGAYTYLIYIAADGSYKARNGLTGADDYSSGPTNPDAGALLISICNAIGQTTPLSIHIGQGDFTVRSWDVTKFRHSNLTIRGQGSGTTSFLIHDDTQAVAGQNRVFAFEGDANRYTSVALAADVTPNTFAVMTDANTDLVAGRHVVIGSDAIISGSAKTGEHNRIVKVIATGSSPAYRIILEKNTRFTYNIANAAFIRALDFLENNHLEGFEIRSFTGNPAQNITFLRFDFNFNLHIRDVRLKDYAVWDSGSYYNGMVFNSVTNSVCEAMAFEQSPERGHPGSITPANAEISTGYAMAARGACETNYFVNCLFVGMIRHCYTTAANSETAKNGHPVNQWLVNCNSETSTEASYDTHPEGDGIHFVNCSVHSSRSASGTDTAAGTEDTDAFNSRSKNTRYINCSVYNNRGNGFACDATATGCVFDGCFIRSIYSGAKGIQASGDHCVVRNCVIEDVDNYAITVGGDNCIVTGNNIKNVSNSVTASPAIQIDANASGVLISNNSITNVPDEGIHLTDANHDCTINGNILQSCAGSGIKVNNSSQTVVTGNRITGCANAITMLGTSNNLAITANIANGNTGASTLVGTNKVWANSGDTGLADNMVDNERVGKAQANGNASTTVFNIAHGLGSNPSYAFVNCSSQTIDFTYTTDSTNIAVTFASAPASGTNNVVMYWRVVA